MIHIGLFEGIGGFSLAAKWAGWETLATCEIEEFPRKVLQYYWPEAYHHKDIYDLNYETLNNELTKRFGDWRTEEICITGGFPCQPFSTAGKRKGTDDNRYLWPEMLRVIKQVKPTFFVCENVAGLTTMENDAPIEKWIYLGMESKNNFRRIYSRYIYRKRQTFVLNEILKSIEEAGYTFETFIIPACATEAPHRRDRIWIVGYSTCRGFQNKQEKESFQNKERNHQDEKQSRGKLSGGITGQCGSFITTNPQIKHNGQHIREQEERQTQQSGECFVKTDAPNADSKGLQVGIQPGIRINGKKKGASQGSEFTRTFTERNEGKEFPTQSPVCTRNDAISFGLDIKTFPTWRKKSIKALGNAVDPEIPYKIFKSINIINP